ncbi:RNase A-like domain-containing protein [Moorena sp. SIO3I6]|uniref:RNase A-like domain-containing protein n=1 Tax=Moorena sp. SIO3I6 TaxID=2607831 RepID=UPI0025FAAC49|nr:RNase A-like domain-containing protein [Moorena sp. SIO3I6]
MFGKSNQQLVYRLINATIISAASTYPDLGTAATNIQAALKANRNKLNSWVLDAGIGEKRAVNYTARKVVGRVANRPPSLSNISNSRNLRAVMKKTAKGDCWGGDENSYKADRASVIALIRSK